MRLLEAPAPATITTSIARRWARGSSNGVRHIERLVHAERRQGPAPASQKPRTGPERAVEASNAVGRLSLEPNAHQGVLEQCAGPARRQGFLGKSLFKEPLSSTTVRSPSQRHLYSPKQTVLRCLKAASGNLPGNRTASSCPVRVTSGSKDPSVMRPVFPQADMLGSVGTSVWTR